MRKKLLKTVFVILTVSIFMLVFAAAVFAAAEAPDTGILTRLMNDFRNAFTAGIERILPDAKWLLWALVVIDLGLALLLNLGDTDSLKLIIKKILKYGFFGYLVLNYGKLINIIKDSFTHIGLKAGGAKNLEALVTDPSKLSEFGIHLAQPILNHIASFKGFAVVENLGTIFPEILMAFIIIASFFFIGIQFFITYLEFYVVGALALILVPFGANKYTSFLGEKAIGAAFSFGIKLMVMSFITSAAIPLTQKWMLPENPDLPTMLYSVLACLAVAFLAHQAPNVAAGLLAGSPSLTGGAAAGAAMAATSAAATVLSKTGKTLGAAAKGIGAITQAAAMGIKGVEKGGEVRGAIQGIGKLALASTFGQGLANAHHAMARYDMAMRAAGMQGRLKPAAGASGAAGTGNTPKPPSAAPAAMQATRMKGHLKLVSNNTPAAKAG